MNLAKRTPQNIQISLHLTEVLVLIACKLHVGRTNLLHEVFREVFTIASTSPPTTTTHFLAADPSSSLPPSPTHFLWRPQQHPGAPFPSTVQPFPQRLLHFTAPPAPLPPHPAPSTSNKRCRSPVCCYSREACSHGRPAPGHSGLYAFMKLSSTHAESPPPPQFYFFFPASKVCFSAYIRHHLKCIVVNVIIHIWGFFLDKNVLITVAFEVLLFHYVIMY